MFAGAASHAEWLCSSAIQRLTARAVQRKREPVHAVYELKPVGDASEVPGAVGGSHQIM